MSEKKTVSVKQRQKRDCICEREKDRETMCVSERQKDLCVLVRKRERERER